MNYRDDEQVTTSASRFGSSLDRIEAAYLRILRGSVLVLASLLIVAAVVLGAISTYKMLRSEKSVAEEVATVTPEDVSSAVPAARVMVSSEAKSPKPALNIAEKNFYSNFVKRYHGLFVTKFEPFRQPDDKRMSQAEFGDAFLDPTGRLQRIAAGELDFATDRADLETMLPTLAAAAELPQTRLALANYRQAKKKQVCHSVQRVRYDTVRGWDSNATHCAGWYESPIGCSVIRTVEIPYSERKCAMQFPKGTRSHADLMRAHQDQYFRLLNDRRSENAARAESERQAIRNDNVEGRMSLMTALQILGGFLLLMFFFLLIAIERHQRRLARDAAI